MSLNLSGFLTDYIQIKDSPFKKDQEGEIMINHYLQSFLFIIFIFLFLYFYQWLSCHALEVLYYFATRYADWYMGN